MQAKILTSLPIFFSLLMTTAAQSQVAPEEILVEAQFPLLDTHSLSGQDHHSSDTAALLTVIPGAAVNRNGGLTGLAQYRGMYADRINVTINQANFASGGPNSMDSPLSYIPTGQLKNLTVAQGLVSVSKGQETIGGYINATTDDGKFTQTDDFKTSADIRSIWNSQNQGSTSHLQMVAANRNHKFGVSLDRDNAKDGEFNGGKDLAATRFERNRYDLFYGYQSDTVEASFRVGNNDTGESGTSALPMDIIDIDTDLASADLKIKFDGYSLRYSINYNDVYHRMDNYSVRRPGMMKRINDATADQWFHKLTLTTSLFSGELRSGVDYLQSRHDALITDPTNATFYVSNFNNAQRDVKGVFIEWERQLSDLTLELGVRSNTVSMDSGKVGNNMNAMLAMIFNNRDRSITDTNIDAVVKINYELNDKINLTAAIGRKNRVASYQERYLWMPMEATGGLADGRTYIGNINLDNESSDELNLGVNYKESRYSVGLHIYYRDINDYIQGTPTSNAMALMMNSTTLEFSNVDAKIVGGELDYGFSINDNWSFSGALSTVRGTRTDSRDNLYRLTPLNNRIALSYSSGQLQASLISEIFAAQNRVSLYNAEKKSKGYGLIHLTSSWTINDQLSLSAGINNVFDRGYQHHLAGYNRVSSNDIQAGTRTHGTGRSYQIGFRYSL